MKVEEKNGKIYIDGLDIIQVLSNYEKECNKLKEENRILKESIANEANTDEQVQDGKKDKEIK